MRTIYRCTFAACAIVGISLRSQCVSATPATSGTSDTTAASGSTATCPTPTGTGAFSVTPELLTAVDGTTGANQAAAGSQTTLGIDYNAEKSFSLGESLEDQIIKTNPPNKPPTAADCCRMGNCTSPGLRKGSGG